MARKMDLSGARFLGGMPAWQRKPKDRITRIATLGALICAAAFVLVTFLPAHAYGYDCGTWTSPTYGGWFDATMNHLNHVSGKVGSMNDVTYSLVSAQCGSALDARRLFALLLLVVGAGVRWGLPYAARRGDA